MVQKYGADSDEEKISEIVKYSILINSKVATKTVSICFLNRLIKIDCLPFILFDVWFDI